MGSHGHTVWERTCQRGIGARVRVAGKALEGMTNNEKQTICQLYDDCFRFVEVI